MPTLEALRPIGGRRLPRPTRVERCTCGLAQGANYQTCAACHDAIERYWDADWAALLAEEDITAGSDDELLLAQVVVEEESRHPWTVVDSAMKRLHCPECGGELCGGAVDCEQCKFAFGWLWLYDQEAGRQGQMTLNEHALRVGRYVVRHPHRYSDFVNRGWRSNLPLILTGQLATVDQAQEMARLARELPILLEDLPIFQTYEEMVVYLRQPENKGR
ncbi:MAG: hypothetical protein SF029_26210 [bacterium]|nr:hypothetical protein [bacterium]